MDKVLLIVPCFNEAQRLKLDEFMNSSPNISFLFANDGSTDNTSHILSGFCDNSRFFLYDSKQNYGKGNIIYHAYQYALREKLLDTFEWIGFWDADLATPLCEVNNMLLLSNYKIKSIWGSRIFRLEAQIRRSNLRHYLARIFATVISNLLKVKSYDTQCGAKIFKLNSAKLAFSEPFISKWIFDVEILLRLKQEGIIEYPLKEWYDVPGSKISLRKDILKIGKDIYSLWRKYI